MNLIIYFTLLIPPLVFFTDLTRNPYYFQIVLLNSCVVLTWLLYLFNNLKNKDIKFKSSPFDAQIFAFLIICTVSWLTVLIENLGHPYMKYSVYSEGSKRWLSLFVNSILVYYMAINFVNDKNRDKVVNVTFLAGLTASVYAIMQYFGIEPIWPKVLNPFGGRSVSSFGNPNFLSSYLVMLLPVALVFFLKLQPGIKRFYTGSVLIILYCSLLCTLTRSSWAGAFCAFFVVAFLLWLYDRNAFNINKKTIVILAAVFTFLIFLWPKSYVGGENPGVLDRLSEVSQINKTYYGSFHQRVLIWSCAWHMVKENPFIGKGWGCFELFYPFYQGRHLFLDMYRNFRTHANNTHNEILEIWSQTGTIGFGIYLWLIFSIVLFSLYIVKNQKDPGKKLMCIGLFASLIGMWVDNMLNVSIHFAVPQFLYWWNLGLLAGLGYNNEVRFESGSALKRLMMMILILWGCFLILRYYRNFMGEVNYFEGFKYAKQNNIIRAIPALEAAHKYQRFEVNNNYELANSYARAGMRDKACWGYMESLKANAGYDEIYFNMATVISQKGNFKEGITEYTRSLFINPLSSEAYNALGTLFFRQPEIYAKAAYSMYAQFVKLFPENKDAWNNLGFICNNLGKYDEALGAYKKALGIDPDFEMAKRNYKAVVEKTKSKDDFVGRVDSLFLECNKNIESKNWDGAYKACSELTKLMPNSYKAKLYMANILYSMKKFDEAVARYSEIIRMKPDSIPTKINMSLALCEIGKVDNARAVINEVLSVDPNNVNAKQAQAMINSRKQ